MRQADRCCCDIKQDDTKVTQCDRLIGVAATLSKMTLQSDLVLATVPNIADLDLSGFRAIQLWSNHSLTAVVQVAKLVDALLVVLWSTATYY